MDGVAFTGTEFCVGDDVTFVCDVLSTVHRWDGPGFVRALIANTRSVKDGADDQFTIAVVNSSASGIITSVSVKFYSGFNGANITCSDGVNPPMQYATATFLGKI